MQGKEHSPETFGSLKAQKKRYMNPNLEKADTSLPFDKNKQVELDERHNKTIQIQLKNREEVQRRSFDKNVKRQIT
jgi:hypothetical protein